MKQFYSLMLLFIIFGLSSSQNSAHAFLIRTTAIAGAGFNTMSGKFAENGIKYVGLGTTTLLNVAVGVPVWKKIGIEVGIGNVYKKIKMVPALESIVDTSAIHVQATELMFSSLLRFNFASWFSLGLGGYSGFMTSRTVSVEDPNGTILSNGKTKEELANQISVRDAGMLFAVDLMPKILPFFRFDVGVRADLGFSRDTHFDFSLIGGLVFDLF